MINHAEGLDYLVINTRTGNTLAAFLLPRDALNYIKWRRQTDGARGPAYDLTRADGRMLSPQISDALERANG